MQYSPLLAAESSSFQCISRAGNSESSEAVKVQNLTTAHIFAVMQSSSALCRNTCPQSPLSLSQYLPIMLWPIIVAWCTRALNALAPPSRRYHFFMTHVGTLRLAPVNCKCKCLTCKHRIPDPRRCHRFKSAGNL